MHSPPIDEAFNQTEATGDTVKMYRVFSTAAKDADIDLSSFLKKMRYTKTTRPARRNGSAASFEEEELENPPPASTWEKMSMRKFPTFDPAWPDEVKANWFDGLSRRWIR